MLQITSDRLQARSGVTLIEMMLVVAVIAALSGLSVPVYQSFQVKNDLDVAANNSAQMLRRAQLLSQASDGDSVWGVKAQSGSLVLFKGPVFATRDAAFDESFDLPAVISSTGVTEFYFAKMTGLPTVFGTLVLTSANGDVKNISINSKGMVSY